MKLYPALGLLLTVGFAMGQGSKTLHPEKIDPAQLGNEPYRYNGLVLVDGARGSGFCAWNRQAFFTAAHVVWTDSGWGAPPTWVATANGDTYEVEDEVQSRGYYRWKSYASLVATSGQTGAAFSRDVVLAYAFQDLIPGMPAAIDLKGYQNLRGNVITMVTGYPGEDAYTSEDLTGYWLYQTGPGVTPYQIDFGRSLGTTLFTTGRGNSGGPVWIRQNNGSWSAAGVLVGGRPSESLVYAFSPDVQSLIRSVSPMVQPLPKAPVSVGGVGSGNYFFPMTKAKWIPDGVRRYTDFKFNVARFEQDARVKKVALSLNISTPHRGDLLVVLQGPGGVQKLVHNETGADADDLILTDVDMTEAFAGLDPNGYWMVRVQDRLKGDVAVVNRILLEIGVEGETPIVEP